MDELERKVLQTIDQFQMIAPGQTVVVALSGGADSLCMLYVLLALQRLRKFSVVIAHVDHCLRETSAEDAAFVRQLGEQLNIPTHVLQQDVSAYAKSHHLSVETAGRAVRYDFFAQLLDMIPNSLVATAHHANDSIESFLMHWMRGSGLTGLTGIHPVRGSVIRPLLHLTRKEIEQYCRRKGLQPRQDETNDTDDYVRNDIRHHVMPPILQRCSTASLLRTMDVVAQEDAFVGQYVDELAAQYVTRRQNTATIDAKVFCGLPIAIRRRLVRSMLADTSETVGLSHIDSVLAMADRNVGCKVVQMPDGLQASLVEGKLLITKHRAPEQ